MKKVMGKIWTGLILNLLVMIAGIFSLSGEYGCSLFTKGFAAVMLLAFLTSLTGVIMLIRGNPVGGIVGAAGSVFFVPIGLVCMIGCLQGRDDIRFAGYARGTPKTPAPAAPLGRIHQAGKTEPAGSAPSAEPITNGRETGSSAPATPSAPPEKTPATSALPAETPLTAYKFTDERLLGFFMLSLGTVLGFYLLSIGGGSGSAFFMAGLGIAVMIRGSRRQNMHVYALYKDRLECVPGVWSVPVSIPYAEILEAEMRRNKACIYLNKPDGREKITIPLGFIPGDKREEAQEAFAAQMRKLGVLREK